MTRKVHCVVDNIDTDGLDFPPWPGAAGKRVFEQVRANPPALIEIVSGCYAFSGSNGALL